MWIPFLDRFRYFEQKVDKSVLGIDILRALKMLDGSHKGMETAFSGGSGTVIGTKKRPLAEPDIVSDKTGDGQR